MKLGEKVGVGPRHNVLNGDPAPSPKSGGGTAPDFRPMSVVVNGWMDEDATWYGGRQHCVR